VIKYIPYFLIILFCACVNKKSIVKPDLLSATSTVNQKVESDLYYEADKERINGNYAKAKELFAECIKINPTNAAAHYFLGSIILKEGQEVQALEHLKIACKLEPANTIYKETLAVALIYNSNITEGTKLLVELSKRNSSTCQDYLYKALHYLEQTNNLNKSLEIIDLLEKKIGFSEDLANRKIRILDKLNNTEAILNEVQKLIAFEPNEAKYYIAKLELVMQLKMNAAEDEMYKQIEARFLDDAEAIRILLRNYREKGNKEKANQMLEQALKNKNIDALSKMELLWPTLKEAGNDSIKRTQILHHFESIYNQAKQNNLVQIAYANVLSEFNKPKEALVMYKKSLDADKNKIETWQAILETHLLLNEYDSTIIVADRAMQIFPMQASFYLYNGQAYLLQEKYTEAITAYSKGLELGKGISQLEESFYGSLADIYNSQKKYRISDSFYKLALDINPSNSSFLNNYAYYLSLRNEQLELAETMSLKSLIINPQSKTFLDTYAWILYKQNKFEKAEIAMRSALDAVGINDAILYSHYGDILFRLGNIDKAIENWKQAQNADPTLPNIEKKIMEKKLYE
jgi:tetratricopeptide (TPR) repeat protein